MSIEFFVQFSALLFTFTGGIYAGVAIAERKYKIPKEKRLSI